MIRPMVAELAVVVRHAVKRSDGASCARLLRLLVRHGRLNGSGWAGSAFPRPMLAALAAESLAAAWGWSVGAAMAREAAAAVPVAVARRASAAIRRGDDPTAHEVLDDALGERAPTLPEGFALGWEWLAGITGATPGVLAYHVGQVVPDPGRWLAGLAVEAERAVWEAYSEDIGPALRARAGGAR